MASDYDLLLSSPDPLGLSFTENPISSPTKSPRKPSTPRKALSDSNGNSLAQHFYLTTPPAACTTSSSPTRSTVLTKGAISPWRIRVTVEAEPETTMTDSPSKRLAEHTITTKVPLKDGASSSPAAAKRGRGRPRKSFDGPVKRNGTPKPKKTRTKKAIHDAMEENTEVDPAEPMSSPMRGRGRPRKSFGSSPAKPSPKKIDGGILADALQETKSSSLSQGARTRGRRKAMTPSKKRAAPDGSTLTTPATEGFGDVGSSDEVDSRTEGVSTKVNRRPAKRRSLEKDHDSQAFELTEEAQGIGADQSQYGQQDFSVQQAVLAKADENMWRSMIRQDSLSPKNGTEQESAESEENDENQEMTGNDPTDEHQEFDSILESEGFSMVSVSSLPSAQQYSGSSAANQNVDFALETNKDSPTAKVSEIGFSNTSNQMRTPSLSSSSSSMPPPPLPAARPRASPRPLKKTAEGTPKLARVVHAGIALQGVLSPGDSNSQHTSSASRSGSSARSSATASSKDRMDNLFDGFGAGTRRELRAGLRLGEELAKRQRRDEHGKRFQERIEDDVFGQDAEPTHPRLANRKDSQAYNLSLPKDGQKVVYPALRNSQLPSPAGSTLDDEDRMSWKASSPVHNEPSLPKARNRISEPVEAQETPQEVRWQREREETSKQIEEANTSQVIVIDSDEEEGANSAEEVDDDADADIWQEEANSSKSIGNPLQHLADALLEAEPPKPRRSKLPNTWRRKSGMIYSDEIEHVEQDAVSQPTKVAAKVMDKGNIAQEEMHQKPSSVSFSTSPDNIPVEVAPTRRQVKVKDVRHPVERPGWKPVKGRLQTPAKKTLKDVLAQKYEEKSEPSASDEEEDISEDNRESSRSSALELAANLQLDSGNTHERSEQSTDEVLGTEASTTMTLEESKEFEIELELTKPLVAISRTPPGSPPEHLYKTLYIPPPQPASTSWLSSLTTYIPTIRTPACTPVPNASTLDPAKWNLHPFGPLYTHLPWDSTHQRVFRPYFEAQMATPNTFPFNPYSPAAALLNTPLWARNNFGWVRYLSKSDCGLIDKFMQVLKVKGVERRPGLYWTGDEKRIDEVEVAKKLFDFWQDGVMHGECGVEVEDGNRVGNVPRSKVPVTPGKIGERRRWKREVFLVP